MQGSYKEKCVIPNDEEITGLGLKESKALVDAAPSRIAEGVSEARANEIKARLESVGARVELK